MFIKVNVNFTSKSCSRESQKSTKVKKKRNGNSFLKTNDETFLKETSTPLKPTKKKKR